MSTALILGISGFVLLVVIIIIVVVMMKKKDDTTESGDVSTPSTPAPSTPSTPAPSTPAPSTPAPESSTPAATIETTGSYLPLSPIIINSTRPICAISMDNNLYCMDQDTNNNWVKVNQTNPKHVAIDEAQNIIYLVKSDGKLVSSPLPSDGKYDKLTWNNLPGTLKQISANKNLVCGVNNDDKIFCTNADANGNFTSFTGVPGELQHVSVVEGQGGHGLHGANSANALWFMTKYPGSWAQNIGSAKQIDGSTLNKQCAINGSDQLHCAWSGSWQHIDPSKTYKYVTVNSSDEAVAIDPSGKPQYVANFKTTTPSWTALPTTSPSTPNKTLSFKQIDF